MNKCVIKILSLLFIVLIYPVASFAQKSTMDDVIKTFLVEEVEDKLSVSVQINLTPLDIQSDEMASVSLTLVSNDNQNRAHSEIFVVAGNLRHKILSRKKKFEPKKYENNIFSLQHNLFYNANHSFTILPWMYDASLILEITVSGCANCPIKEYEWILKHNVLTLPAAKEDEQVMPFKVTFIKPEIEALKSETALLKKTFDFKKSHLNEDFHNHDLRKLSLNELYQLAQIYEPSSNEAQEIYEAMLVLFPESDIAIINCGVKEILCGNFERAIKLMNPISDNFKTWNNLGVAHYLNQQFEKGKAYFEKSAAKGDADSISNLKILDEIENN